MARVEIRESTQGGAVSRRPALIVALSVLGTLLVSGAVMTAVDSQATSTSKSICVDKKTKELKLRKNCRANENFFASAEVLTKGGISAYDTWLELGNKGSKQQFLNSLIGPGGSSGSSSASNPFAGMNCYGAVFHAENQMGRSRVVKADWEFMERQTNCERDQNQAMWYTGLNRDLNDSLKSFDISITGSAVRVQSTGSVPGHYEVPIKLDFEIDIGDEWVVCDSTLPIYRNSSWQSNADVFDQWDLIEDAKVSDGVYSLNLIAAVYSEFIIFDAVEEEVRVFVCKEDPTNSRGWSMVTLFPLPLAYPGDFVGLNIPYISDWGWE